MNHHMIHVMGRAVAPAEGLQTKAGKDFVKFTVAVNEFRGKDNDPVAYFYNIACFQKQPKNIGGKINKGDLVYITGKPDMRAYISQEGEARVDLGINAHHLYNFNTGKKTETEQVKADV